MKPVHRFVAMALGVLLALSLVPASHAQAQGDSRRAEHDRVVAFWTKDKVAKAKGRDFVLDPKTKRFKPSAKPGGGGSTQTVLGARGPAAAPSSRRRARCCSRWAVPTTCARLRWSTTARTTTIGRSS